MWTSWITTEEDTNVVFGIKEKDYEAVAERLAQTFKFRIVAITLREDLSVLRNNWTAIAYQDGKIYKDKKYEVEIVDRVGAGDSLLQDSFTAGSRRKTLKRASGTGMPLPP